MPRKANANKHLKPSTKRFYQFMIDSGKSRSDFASELGLSVSGLNNIFLRGNDISEVLARAAEQAFGVNHRWLLEGEEPPLVTHESLLPSDLWLLNGIITSINTIDDERITLSVGFRVFTGRTD